MISLSILNLIVSAHFIPEILPKKHKSKRMTSSLENLCCYQDEGESLVESMLREMKHGFTSSSLSQNETP
jgi:hypothetical protein